jgi:hypothetical protein
MMNHPTTVRAPSGVMLEKVVVALEEDAVRGVERTTIDIHLVIALLRFAIEQDALCVGDLTDAC